MAQEKHENIDSVILFIVIKKIVTPITRTDAYKFGLVDNAGKVIKIPKTDEEKEALTTLDKFIFKLKRLLGAKLTVLNKFLYLQTLNNDFYNKLIIKGTIDTRSEIKRIKKDVEKIQEGIENAK